MTKLLFDETHERAGWVLMLAGLVLALLGGGAVLTATAWAAYHRVPGPQLGPAATVACLGGVLAAGGYLGLVGVRRFAGLRATGPRGVSMSVEGEVQVTQDDEED